MNYCYKAFITLFLYGSIVPVAQLSIDEAIRMALKNHHAIKAQHYHIAATKLHTESINSKYLPQISTTYETQANQDFVTPNHIERATVQVKQHLFSQQGPLEQRSIIAFETDIAKHQQRLLEINLHKEIVFIYLDAWLALQRRQVAIARSIYHERKKQLCQIQLTLKTASPLTTYNKELIYLKQKQESEGWSREYFFYKESLAHLIGQDVHNFSLYYTPPQLPSVEKMDYYTRTAQEHRPEIASLKERVKQKEAELRYETGAFFPEISLHGQYAYLSSHKPVLGQQAHRLSGNLVFSWNLFNGFETSHKRAQRQTEKLKLIEDIESLKQSLAQQVRRAFHDYIQSREHVLYAQNHYLFAKIQCTSTLIEYQLGKIGLIDLLEHYVHFCEAYYSYLSHYITALKQYETLQCACGYFA